jgi:signal transduction histidine kinase
MRLPVRVVLTALGIAIGYFGLMVLGLELRFSPESSAIVWPARAFVVSLTLLLPRRQWGLVAAVVPAHYLASAAFLPDASLVAATTQVLGHIAVALASALAIRRLIPNGPLFDSAASMLKFILVVGIAVPAVVNLATLSAHLATGWIDSLWLAWRQWMGSGFFVTITVPPLLVLLAQGGFAGRPRATLGLRLEIALVAALLSGVSFVAFGSFVDATAWPAAYLAPLPLLLWAAARFGTGGTALALLAMTGGVVARTIRHEGPFGGDTLADEVASLQLFLAVTSAPMMLLAALFDERRRTANLLRQFEADMQVAASATATGLWRWDAAQSQLWLTANCRAMFGLPDESTLTPLDFLAAVHPEDRAAVEDALTRSTAGEQMRVLEFRLGTGERTRWFVLQTRTDYDDGGRAVGVSGVFRDISERVEGRLAVERLEERLATLQDDERRRIAQELHDSTAQHLVAAKFNLLTLRKRVAGELQEMVDEAYRSLREATAEIRTFTYLLHASQLEEEGLGAMLQRYVPGFERRTGIRTALRLCPRADELPGALQHALMRITQESLGNVQRHAGAKRASIDLRCFSGAIHLVVRDDGRGIGSAEGEQLAERLRLGLGLPGLTVRSRAAAGRGHRNPRGRGTTVHISVPTDSPAPAGRRGIANLARETLGAGRG